MDVHAADMKSEGRNKMAAGPKHRSISGGHDFKQAAEK
jgi:hypothetical protein